jgi:predicted  nucleic acid-binding Zn-ribbon protein
MSGRKYSEYELARNVREAIACRLAAEEAVGRAEALAGALEEAARSTSSLAPAAVEVQATLVRARAELEAMRKTFRESTLLALDLDEVVARRQRVQALQAELEATARRCREGSGAAAVRAELAAVLARLEREAGELEPWLRDVWSGYTGETRGLLERIDAEIRASGATSAEGIVAAHSRLFEEMLGRAAERRTADQQRRYVARALEEACREALGFAARALPQNGPLDDLVVEVNTFAYGIIEFRLQLDGTIRSESGMAEDACWSNYPQLEDKLRQLGVHSSFRYVETDQPVRLEKGSKELPGSEGGAVSKGTAR